MANPASVWVRVAVFGSDVGDIAAHRPLSGSVDMNERPKLGSEQGGLNVHLWVKAGMAAAR
ncbi:hypothetical protein ACLBWH_18100 [Sphingomonas sp. M6A6_1c]